MTNRIIYIKRMLQSENSTISKYYIPGTNISGFMLERPGPDTTEANLRKRIPEGHYHMKWHYSHIPSVKPYNPVPLIYNHHVSMTRHILIHNGNYPRNTDGCLLIGGTKGIDFVGGSVNKLKELNFFLQKEGIDTFKISISSCYTFCD